MAIESYGIANGLANPLIGLPFLSLLFFLFFSFLFFLFPLSCIRIASSHGGNLIIFFFGVRVSGHFVAFLRKVFIHG